MKKIFVNITTWAGTGAIGAEHYYAKATIFEDTRNIYTLARAGWYVCEITDHQEVTITKPLSEEEAKYLNKKDGFGTTYRKGAQVDRFDSVGEIKAKVKELYPGTDIAFFTDKDLQSEEIDVYEAQPQAEHKKTGRKIKIHNFKGFSKEFVNLTEGSIHDVIETPERYKDKELQDGVWVWGVTEPVLVLKKEFKYVE